MREFIGLHPETDVHSFFIRVVNASKVYYLVMVAVISKDVLP